jgi:hypothetical protein
LGEIVGITFLLVSNVAFISKEKKQIQCGTGFDRNSTLHSHIRFGAQSSGLAVRLCFIKRVTTYRLMFPQLPMR